MSIVQPPRMIMKPMKPEKPLADVMEEAFKTNSKEAEDNVNDGESEKENDGQEEEPKIQQPEGYTMSAVYPPHPCERCVRANRTCKGVSGVRCEYCKTLHQKCSNSTGPGRNKPTANVKASTPAGSSDWQSRPKRKATTKAVRDTEDDYDDEDDEPAHLPPKKRRAGQAAPAGTRQARLLKDLADLEASIKRLQANTVKEVAKLQQIAASLTDEIRTMDED